MVILISQYYLLALEEIEREKTPSPKSAKEKATKDTKAAKAAKDSKDTKDSKTTKAAMAAKASKDTKYQEARTEDPDEIKVERIEMKRPKETRPRLHFEEYFPKETAAKQRQIQRRLRWQRFYAKLSQNIF